MRHLRPALLLALAASLLLVPERAEAQRMDLQIWRLGNPRPITLADGEVVPADPLANERFRMVMVDLGLAMSPTPMHPANSLGRAGAAFEFGLRLPEIHPVATLIGDSCPRGNPSCQIWVTRGNEPGRLPQQPPSSRLVAPVLQVRKGLPFSFELGSKVQYLAGSSIVAATGSMRWALNEGFDFLPDLSVGGQATRFVGTRDFGLTTASVDVLVGKWFAIQGMAAVAPYLGWQRVWVSAVSGVVDFDPGAEVFNDPTRDDTVFNEVFMASNAYDRMVFGLRVRSHVAQVLFEGNYQPEYLGMTATVGFTAKVGLDF
jgi:hypothetical protein